MRILSTLDREVLKPNTSVALHRHSHSVVEILPPESDSTIQLMQERPDVTYHDIGGMDMQKQEVMRSGTGLANVTSCYDTFCAHGHIFFFQACVLCRGRRWVSTMSNPCFRAHWHVGTYRRFHLVKTGIDSQYATRTHLHS